MDLINTNSAWNKNSPELWAYVFEFLGHPNPDISKSSREGSSLFQERFYLDITEFYREDGGELFVMKHFSLLPEYPIAEKLERIMERIGAASIHFHGIGLMGKRVLVAYEDNLKIEILETWKRMKGGRNYINKYRASLLLLPGLEFGRAFRKWKALPKPNNRHVKQRRFSLPEMKSQSDRTGQGLFSSFLRSTLTQNDENHF